MYKMKHSLSFDDGVYALWKVRLNHIIGFDEFRKQFTECNKDFTCIAVSDTAADTAETAPALHVIQTSCIPLQNARVQGLQ